MKNILLFFGVFNTLVALTAAEFQPGGTTFDFEKISNQRFQKKAVGKNLLGSKWLKYYWGPQIKKTFPLMVFERKQNDKEQVLSLSKPREIEKIAGNKSSRVCSSWHQNLNLSDAKGGTFELSLSYLSRSLGKNVFKCSVVMEFFTASGKSLPCKSLMLSAEQHRWANINWDFDIPEKVAKIGVNLRCDGAGEISFKNPVLVKKETVFPVSVVMTPHGWLDNTFVLSQNDPAELCFAWKRNVALSQWKQDFDDLKLNLEIPPEISVLEAVSPLTNLQKSNEVYTVSLRKAKNNLNPHRNYETWFLLPLLLTTKAEPCTRLAVAHYWITNRGKIVSEKKPIYFSVQPQIPTALRSKIFMNGIRPQGWTLMFKQKENLEFFTKFYGRLGFRAVVNGTHRPQYIESYRKNGTDLYTVQPYWVANGYRLGSVEGKPDYAKFVYRGKKSFDLENGTCPIAIYEKTDYLKNTLAPYIKKVAQYSDGITVNWEPFMFHGRGCFCVNCRKEFARYAKISDAEVKKIWPQEIVAGKKYYPTWVKFRSWQHAKMVRVLDEIVTKSSSGKVGFCADVSWTHLLDSPERLNEAGEHDPFDFVANLKWLDPWGPYVFWRSLTPYNYTKGVNLPTYVSGKLVQESLKKHLPKGVHPKLFALPHAIQCDFWVTNPESVAMETLGFFLNRYEASIIYFFPNGYDNRYWAVLSQANQLAAMHEQLVFKGERLNDIKVSSRTPFPAPKKRIFIEYLNNLPEESLLQVAAFKGEDKILAAVGNFWEKGDSFFSLKVPNLSSGWNIFNPKRYVIWERDKNRAFTAEGERGFTSAELEQGVLLHVGALRWAFFEIVPEEMTRPAGMALIDCRQVADNMTKRQPCLKTLAAKEAQIDAWEDKQYVKSDLKSLENQGVRCIPGKTASGEQKLTFTSGKNSLTLLLNGMVAQSWKIAGKELIAGDKTRGLASPAFSLPGCQLLGRPFIVSEQKVTATGLSVTAEHQITRAESPELERLLVKQTLEVSKDLRKVVFKTTLVNKNTPETGMAEISPILRYHILPLCLGEQGSIELNSPQGKLEFRRRHQLLVLARENNELTRRMCKNYGNTKEPIIINDNCCFWKFPNGPRVQMELLPKSEFVGYAVWDTSDLKAPTFEPFFKRITIPAGQSTQYKLSLEIKK